MRSEPNTNAGSEASIKEDLVVLLEAIEDWASAAQGRVAAVARLAAAEARLAMGSVVAMAAFAIITALFLLASWSFLVLGLYFSMTSAFSMSAYHALFILSGLHIVSAFALWQLIKRLSRNIRFKATRAAFGHSNERGASTHV